MDEKTMALIEKNISEMKRMRAALSLLRDAVGRIEEMAEKQTKTVNELLGIFAPDE